MDSNVKNFFDFNTKPVICFARLRNTDRYVEPLNSIMDSFYYVITEFMEKYRDKYNYTFYSIEFGNRMPKKDYSTIEMADYVVVLSDAEYTFHVPGRIDPLHLDRTNMHLNNIRKIIDDKHIIVCRSDRADDENLYREYTFPNNNIELSFIDECDFVGGIHTLKYYFISEYITKHNIPFDKEYDFVYWGSSKRHSVRETPPEELFKYGDIIEKGKESDDERDRILRDIRMKKNKLDTFFIGSVIGNSDYSFTSNMKEIIPMMCKGNATLCFNWPGYDEYTTSRYNEAIACGVIPLVWKNYDINNTLVFDDWQRCYSFEEVHKKIKDLQDKDFREITFNKIHEDYLNKIKDKTYYIKRFDKLINRILN